MKTIEILLASLNKSDDKRITEQTILALGQIVERYSFPDLRIYQTVALFFDINSKAIKNAVATTLSKFKTSDKWVYIIEIGKKSPNKFGQELVVRAVRSDVGTIPLSMKPQMREILVNMEKSSSVGQKAFIKAAIDVLDGKEDKIASLFGPVVAN